MDAKRVCVVIPTRERAVTLKATLQTCTSQDYGNLEIIVCDNYSGDDTRDVVSSCGDARVSYVNSGRRLSMSDNWELALSQVSADYVIFLGDDDGLLPSAVSDLVALAESTSAQVVTWKKAEYCWPDHLCEELRNYLSVPLGGDLVRISSKRALNNIFSLRLSYARGPCIYNSMVSIHCLRRVLDRDGRVFNAASPDVYSSLILASVTEWYLYSGRPFSVNGASSRSNGVSSIRQDVDGSVYGQFISEYAYRDVGFYSIRGSITAAVVDSLVAYSGKARVRAPSIHFPRAFSRIRAELDGRYTDDVAAYLQHLENRFLTSTGSKVSLAIRSMLAGMRKQRGLAVVPVTTCDELVLWADRFGVANVMQACELTGKLLGKYARPVSIKHYSWMRYAISKLIGMGARWNYRLSM